MKKYLALCDQVYTSLRGKIEFGIYPEGSQLPSVAVLRETYGISLNTVKRVIEKLSRDGLVETSQGRRARVMARLPSVDQEACLGTVDRETAIDIMRSAGYFSAPFIWRGAACCNEEDLALLEEMAGKVEAAASRMELWRLTMQFWRVLIAKEGNELALRCMDNMGQTMFLPMMNVSSFKDNYIEFLRQSISLMKEGKFDPDHIDLGSLGELFLIQRDYNLKWLRPNKGAAGKWPESIGKGIRGNEKRISTIYMDIIGQIAGGHYGKGERLPSHAELCAVYNASHDSTVKAVRYLRELGVVSSVRGKGIFVRISADEAKTVWVAVDRDVICGHLRYCLDTMEVVSMTIENTASHALESMKPEDARILLKELEKDWEAEDFRFSAPAILLDFIGNHIELRALNEIYKVLRRNYILGRCIPELIIRDKKPEVTQLYRLCVEAGKALECSAGREFVTIAAEVFKYTHSQFISRCRQLGFWESMQAVYDEALSWR